VRIRPVDEQRDLYAVQYLYRYLLESKPTIEFVRRVIKGADLQIVDSESGEPIAFSIMSRRNTMPPEQAFVWISVAEHHRRQGIGNALMNEINRHAAQRNFTELISQVDDSNTVGLAFCRQHGFHYQRHMVRMKIDWDCWDESILQPALDQAQQTGIQFVTYAKLGDHLENRRRLYTLNKTLSASIPISEPEDFPDLEPYTKRRLTGDSFPHEGIFLAVAERQWIGMTQMSLHDDYAFVEMTGVLPSHRRRGIAQALKLLSIRFAQQAGYNDVRTMNDKENEPMLAVNEKSGFRKSSGFYFVRQLLNGGDQ
jgi:ribosomal protein S18 acetylase RimI-like enzyme